MSSSSLAISLALRYTDDAQKIISRTIEQLKDPKLQEHLVELTVAQNHMFTVADHVKSLRIQLVEPEKTIHRQHTRTPMGRRSAQRTEQPARDNYSSNYPTSPTWNSSTYGSSSWASNQAPPPPDDKIRSLTTKVSALEKELRETIYDKDALISVKMEELAHLQERLDGRDTLLTQREMELDDLRSRMRQDARMATNIKQEAVDEMDHRRHSGKDLQLIRKDEEIEELHRRLNESSNSSRGQLLPHIEQQSPEFIPQDFLTSSYPPNIIVRADEFAVVLSNERNLAIPRDVGLPYDGVWRHYHDEITWGYGPSRYDRCVVMAPNIVYSRDKQRYEKEYRHHRLGQTKDLFWRREIKGMREWYYLGRYQCIAATTMKLEDARFVNKQAPKALSRRTNEDCTIVKNLYEIDALQCRCIALERVGFNEELQSLFSRHFNHNLKRRESFDRDDREDWNSKRRR